MSLSVFCSKNVYFNSSLRKLSKHLYVRLFHTGNALLDRSRQPTGAAGHVSPWRRTPFFHERGPPIGVDLSLQERLDELYAEDDVRGEKIDIGFKQDSSELNEKGKIADWRRSTRANRTLEKAAREGTLEVDLSVVREQWVESGSVFEDVYNAAELYGVYDDMYQHAFFKPCVMLEIKYKFKNFMVPVHRGNVIKPSEAASPPEIIFKSSKSSLWCLVLTGLDSNMNGEGEVLHWFVGNIKGNDVAGGQTICNYLQPFPPFGTGYHRFAFVLYRQEEEIDFSDHTVQDDESISLDQRNFSSYDFYSKYQEKLTPAGLAFFQSDYEASLRNFFHDNLAMKEPRYEYEFPDWYVRPWNNFFHTNLKDGFDEFLDRHRDPKDLEKEVLECKLAHTNPFTGDTEAYVKYPGIHEQEFGDVFPPPVGEKRLNKKQSYKIAQWRRNALQKQRLKERYFRSSDHKDLRRDPSMSS